MKLPPPVADLRKMLEVAPLPRVRAAVDGTIERLNAHLTALVANPENFTSRVSYVEKMPADAYHNGCEYFMTGLRAKLAPLGYCVAKSHDGGGMYDTVVIRWDIVRNRTASVSGGW